jgi:hypothetical protein
MKTFSQFVAEAWKGQGKGSKRNYTLLKSDSQYKNDEVVHIAPFDDIVQHVTDLTKGGKDFHGAVKSDLKKGLSVGVGAHQYRIKEYAGKK